MSVQKFYNYSLTPVNGAVLYITIIQSYSILLTLHQLSRTSSSASQVPRQISFVSSAHSNASRRILANFTISSITQPSTPFYSFEHIFSSVRVKWQLFEVPLDSSRLTYGHVRLEHQVSDVIQERRRGACAAAAQAGAGGAGQATLAALVDGHGAVLQLAHGLQHVVVAPHALHLHTLGTSPHSSAAHCATHLLSLIVNLAARAFATGRFGIATDTRHVRVLRARVPASF